jgi:Flp pilus assembly CpaE family ATPase
LQLAVPGSAIPAQPVNCNEVSLDTKGFPMSATILHILLIEDNAGDAVLVREMLRDAAEGDFAVDWVPSVLSGLDRLGAGNIDVVLLDLTLPDSRGLDGLYAIRRHAPAVPVILLTGLSSDSMALQAMKTGAQEYVVKGTLKGHELARTIQHAVLRQRTLASAQLNSVSERRGIVAGLIGAKGGVGTTTVACHLARQLAQMSGDKVLLMDLDEGSNAFGFLMQANGAYSMLDVTSDLLRLDASFWSKVVTTSSDGIDVIRSGGPMWTSQPLSADRVRFVLHFVRTLYRFVVIDCGRLSPLAAGVARDADNAYIVGTPDVLGLHEARWTAQALLDAGFTGSGISVILNRVPTFASFSASELEKIIGLRVANMLPDCGKDFGDPSINGKRLGENRALQKHVSQIAAEIAGVECVNNDEETPLLRRLFGRAKDGASASAANAG